MEDGFWFEALDLQRVDACETPGPGDLHELVEASVEALELRRRRRGEILTSVLRKERDAARVAVRLYHPGEVYDSRKLMIEDRASDFMRMVGNLAASGALDASAIQQRLMHEFEEVDVARTLLQLKRTRHDDSGDTATLDPEEATILLEKLSNSISCFEHTDSAQRGEDAAAPAACSRHAEEAAPREVNNEDASLQRVDKVLANLVNLERTDAGVSRGAKRRAADPSAAVIPKRPRRSTRRAQQRQQVDLGAAATSSEENLGVGDKPAGLPAFPGPRRFTI